MKVVLIDDIDEFLDRIRIVIHVANKLVIDSLFIFILA